MFSYVDLVRMELALEVEQRFNTSIPDSELDEWLTLGDVARSVVGHVATATEAEVVNWVRTFLVEDYGATEVAHLTAADDVFSDYDRATAWFFTSRRSRSGGSIETHRVPYYCAYGAPYNLQTIPPVWRTGTVVAMASQMSEFRDFSALPILADALQEAGCADTDVLHHCRDPKATHIYGCWVIDWVLGKGRYRAK